MIQTSITPAGRRILALPRSAVFWLTGAVMLLTLVLGGASRQNLTQVIVLELVALPLLACAVWRLTVERRWPSLGFAGLILAILPAVPLFQLIPVPFALWAQLPGHAPAAEAALQAGLAPEWRSISLAPLETWQSMLALAPPVAVFLGVSLVTETERRRLCLLVPAVAMVSLLIGALQITGGDASPFYFYEVTNRGWAVGLFANRNHQASLLAMSLPFAALWLCNASPTQRSAILTSAVALGAYVTLVVIGLVIVGSRAGVLLLAPALVLTAFMLIRADRYGGKRGLVVGAVSLALVAAMASLIMGPLVARFTTAAGDQRFDTASVVASTAWQHQPIGAGLGSFPLVYAGAEPVDIMAEVYFNHAHNDYLEIWLESGILGVAAMLAFIGWWANRSLRVWTLPSTTGRNMARAGSSAIAMLLIHSVVDYPSRTLAIAVLLALSCALLASRPTDFGNEPRQMSGAKVPKRNS